MLKIKDEVDLKELEKFGFEKFEQYQKNYIAEASEKDIDLYNNQYRGGCYYIAGIHILINKDIFVWIDIYSYENPEVSFESNDPEYYIQDLIKAGLVEKVEKMYDSICD